MIRPARARSLTRAARTGAASLAGLLVGAVVTVGAGVPPTARAAESDPGGTTDADASAAPLSVTIRTLTPASLPRRGTVTVTGTVTNHSESTWSDLDVYLFMSEQPITTSDELAEANGTEAEVNVGPRITTTGLYDQVSDLEPGESTDYLLSVPRSALPAVEEGVYWIGVHVLGTDEDGRADGADGRARTFIPLVGGQQPRTSLSLVVPMKSRIVRTKDGSLGNPGPLGRHVAEDGRLTRLLELSGSGTGVSLTWVVDPALIDAIASLAAGDPPFDIGPTDRDENPAADPEASPSPAEEGEQGEDSTDEPAEDLPEEALVAAGWLEDFVDQASGHSVLTVPYGDLDVASVLRRNRSGVYERSLALSALSMERLGVRGTPVVAPTDGRLPNDVLTSLDTSTTLLLDEGALNTEDRVVRMRQGHLVVRGSQVARVGGPAPTEPFGALALRQRILAEAAVHALAGDPEQPLVVSMPATWNPGADWRSAAFFPAMDQPWLRTISLPFATALARTGAYDGGLAYPQTLRRKELPGVNLAAIRTLDSAGGVLADLLNRNDTIDDQVGGAAMLGVSYSTRLRPAHALARTQRTTAAVRDQLQKVRVESSPLVTMSSETGNFSVTVVNGLDEPVTVGITAQTGTPELEIRSPDLVSLGPGQRASVRLAVTATDTGVHSVSIMPTTQDGRPLGHATTIKVRSSQVGLVIWLIMGTGAAVFVIAITVRVVRRLRSRKDNAAPVQAETTLTDAPKETAP